jgi:hypothetical protein
VKSACLEANHNHSRDTVKIRDEIAAGTIGTSWMLSAVGLPEQAVGKSATAKKTATLNRDTSKSSMNSQLEHYKSNSYRDTGVNSRRETCNSKDARNSD